MRRLQGVDDSDEEDVKDVQPVEASTAASHDGGDNHGSGDDESGSGSGSEGSGDGGSGSDDDSSEEEDDDEQELAKVREGFIVDEDEESSASESESGQAARAKRRRRLKKRQRSAQTFELDEDDLELVRGAAGDSPENKSRFKRLKRLGGDQRKGTDLKTMFSDDDDEASSGGEGSAREGSPQGGEFDDFIVDDEMDDDEAQRRQEEREIQTRKRISSARMSMATELEGLSEDKIGEIFEIFGDGETYDWALEREDEADQRDDEDADRPLDLHDVFEPSELAARMLTAEDNTIRAEDVPERYQLQRQALKHGYELSNSEFQEKREWVAREMVQERRLLFTIKPELRAPFIEAVVKVLEFIAFESLEVPFIWHHRKDYLVLVRPANETGEGGDDKPVVEELLTQDDLWRIVMLDMDFHAMLEKRKATDELWASLDADNSQFPELLARASTLVEYQDVMDWIQYTYSARIRERVDRGDAGKRHSRFRVFDRIRSSPVYEAVLAAVDAAAVADRLQGRHRVVEDPAEEPDRFPDVSEGDIPALTDTIAMDLFHHPVVRRFFRQKFVNEARIDVVVTDDGKRKIDDNSPYADIKYAHNWSFDELRLRPELYLRMLAAEQQGLVVVRVQYPQYRTTLFEDALRDAILSDGTTDVSAAWNTLRRAGFKAASRLIVPLIARNIREDLRSECLRALQFGLRTAFAKKLDQAPYKPAGFLSGTIPRVLAVSAGEGQYRDAVLGVVVDEEGQVIEHTKLGDARDAAFKAAFVELVKRREVDVVGVAGWTASTRRLFNQLQDIIADEGLQVGEQPVPLDVRYVNDEVARLYQSSTRATVEYPDMAPVARYCVGLARYMQSPLLEYAALGPEIAAIQIHPHQDLLPGDQFRSSLDSAFVDFVCLDGVDINLAVRSPYVANLVPYIAGLGPRKASGILQAIQSGGGQISNRTELITSDLTSKTIFMNSASFFKIPQDSMAAKEDDADVLDSTRIHPEDYELARKMVGDALELDEEDIAAYESQGRGGVVAQLEDPERLEELILEDYAAELEKSFKQKKLCTLETIRDELKDPYRELRKPLTALDDLDVFSMLTGETKATFRPDLVVSAVCRRVTNRQLVLTLSCGVDAVAESGNISDDRMQPITAQFAPGQAVQAVLLTVDYKTLFATVSTRAGVVQEALAAGKPTHDPAKWNFEAEKRDETANQQRIAQEQRQGRIIKHPLFRLFTAKQAEEYLAPLERGDLVIRPSSRGNDYLVVTWKVADMLYQHVVVKELDKPNDYTIGRILQVDQWQYSDLDELIIMHIQAMARKVDEMTQAEKFQAGTKADVDRWLTSYTAAMPKQSIYAFCFDHKRPGYFLLCFKTGAASPVQTWHVKVIPNGYELMRNAYPDVPGLCNGFKMIFAGRVRQQ